LPGCSRISRSHPDANTSTDTDVGTGPDAQAADAGTGSVIGLALADAGYLSEHNLTCPGPDRLIAAGKRRDLETSKLPEGPQPRPHPRRAVREHQVPDPRIRADQHTLTAEDPVPPDLRDAVALIERPEGAH
jgi:hypothetical protein